MKVTPITPDTLQLTREITQILPRLGLETQRDRIEEQRQQAVDRHTKQLAQFDAQLAYLDDLTTLLDQQKVGVIEDKLIAAAFSTPSVPVGRAGGPGQAGSVSG